MDHKLQLLTPTPRDRLEWERNRNAVWTFWAALEIDERPEGSKLAPVAAIIFDWNGHFGPIHDETGRRVALTEDRINEYAERAGAGFDEYKSMLMLRIEE